MQNSLKYLIDKNIIEIIKKYFKVDVKNITTDRENNQLALEISLYKQILIKFLNKGKPNICDFYSSKFLDCLKENNNYLSEGKQKKNIETYFMLEGELRKNAKNLSAILYNNQSEISQRLEDIKESYETVQKTGKNLKRVDSFDNSKRRRKYNLDFNQDNPKGDRKESTNPKKRNTVFISDILAFVTPAEKQSKKKMIKKKIKK